MDDDLRARLIRVTVDLLEESDDPAAITVRQIAARAEVGVGSINYNFGSRDGLIIEAIWQLVGEIAAGWYTPDTYPDVDPQTRLRRLLKDSADAMLRHRKYADIALRHVLNNGDMQAKILILPLLREIFGAAKSDIALRMTAFQLIAALQVAFVNLPQVGAFLGIDTNQPATIHTIIDAAVDNLIGSTTQEDRS